MHKEDIVLYRDKSKTRKLLLTYGAILSVLVLIFVYSTGFFTGEYRMKAAVISAFLALIFGIYLVKTLLRFNDHRPLVVINSKGLEAKVTPMSRAAGFIAKEDVLQVSLVKVGGDLLVAIILGNAERYKDRIRKKLSKLVLDGAVDKESGNLRVYLSTAELDCSAEELQLYLLDHLK